MGRVIKGLGIANAIVMAFALLLFAAPMGFAEEAEDADKGCWVTIESGTYCCSWLICNCRLGHFGECTTG